jgi:hypothetical protein
MEFVMKMVFLEDIGDIATGGEDEAIARIDAQREEAKAYESDLGKANESLIQAVHTARRFFV